ncbi:unnamed protein product [Meganyctiphanes norvegica]|uniref:Uncharacterized protein n=1 Tax=Meganyctiphanes norvegica TaxID=48144 RepID=A0AAV2PJL4_MEGNR
MSDGTDSELACLDESSHGNEETRFHREDSEEASLDESSLGDKGTISHMNISEKASWDESSYDDNFVDMTPTGSSTCNSNCKCHFDIDGRPQPPCYTCSMYNCFQADRTAEPSAPLDSEEGYPTAPPSYTQDVGPLHIQPEELDKDAILMEAVAESNIKKVTHLLKFIHELDPDTVSVAHEVANDIKNPIIIRLMDSALKKITEKKSIVESPSANSCDHEMSGSSSMEAGDVKLTEKQIKANKELMTTARIGDSFVNGKRISAVKLVSNALRSGADINYRGDFGATALLVAAHWGHEDVVDKLLQVPGIDVNLPNSNGWTPLHGACYRGNAEPVRQLLEHKNINVNLQAKDGLTPLGLALKYKKHSIADALCSAGAVE